MAAYDTLRNLLFLLPAEEAHHAGLLALKLPMPAAAIDPKLRRRVLGIDFPGPVGMAAGFDKNGDVPDGLLRLGFGFTEIGTVTPLAQPGNPKPRLFRLPGNEALINRLGFNSPGAARVEERVARRARRGVVGINVGANRDSPDRIADYVDGVKRFAPYATYLAMNISSPNTSGLRDLQGKASLRDLLSRAKAARDAAGRTPLLVKLAPDLTDQDIDDIAEVVLETGIDGAMIGNTTVRRPALRDAAIAREAGGLSGPPLFQLSTIVLAKFRKRVGPKLPLVGVGGIDSGETAWQKLSAGADLVQLYTGLVYRGPSLPRAINRYLVERMAKEGMTSLDPLIGRDVETWAEQALR